MSKDKEEYKPLSKTIIGRRRARKNKLSPNSLIVLPTTQIFKNTAVDVLAVGPEKILSDGTALMPDIEVGDVVHVIAFDSEALDPLNDPELGLIKQELCWFVVKEVPIDADETNCIIINDDNWKPRAKE